VLLEVLPVLCCAVSGVSSGMGMTGSPFQGVMDMWGAETAVLYMHAAMHPLSSTLSLLLKPARVTAVHCSRGMISLV
jgi:hypothetical protein